MRTPRRLAAVAGLALVASGCSDDGTAEAPAPGGPLVEALGSLPASTELVRFVDRAGAAERLGIAGLESLRSPAERTGYEEALADAEWAFTELGGFAREMSTRGAFSELDVVWEARGALPNEEGRLDGWAVFRMEDGLDLDEVADAMVGSGWTEREVAGERQLVAPAPDRRTGLVDGTYPYGLLHEVTFLPEHHLLVTGDAGPVVEVVERGAVSLLDDGKMDGVVEPAQGVEYVELRTAAAIDCAGALAGAREVPEATLRGAWAQLGMEGLRKPEVSALYVVAAGAGEQGKPPVRGVTMLEFADEATARADAEVRAAWLETGTDQVTRLPMAQLYDTLGQVVDGERVTVEWTYGSNLAAGVRAHQTGAGVASCAEL